MRHGNVSDLGESARIQSAWTREADNVNRDDGVQLHWLGAGKVGILLLIPFSPSSIELEAMCWSRKCETALLLLVGRFQLKQIG